MNLRIAYLLESTALCGGVKVVFRQAEALARRGHVARVISAEPYPDWFHGNVRFQRTDPFDKRIGDAFQITVATTPRLVLAHRDTGATGRLWHLVQGYEGDYTECRPLQDEIDTAYGLPVPKITVSERLARRLGERYPGSLFVSVGQGLETEHFHPAPGNHRGKGKAAVRCVFLVGPLSISIKQIRLGLLAFKTVRERFPHIALVRISSIDTRREEETLIGAVEEYRVHLHPKEVGELFRSREGILLSPSGPGEGFGLPALEAMACGVPTVLTRIPSYLAFDSPQDYTVFVDPSDPADMARGIEELIRDDEKRRFLVRRGIEVASRYSFDSVAERLEKVFTDAI